MVRERIGMDLGRGHNMGWVGLRVTYGGTSGRVLAAETNFQG